MADSFVLEAHVGFLLRKAHQRHAAIFLEAAAEHGLTPVQYAALAKTVENGRTTQNLLDGRWRWTRPRSRAWCAG